MNEIITLSFGEYSNYTNTHFWNLLVEISRQKEFIDSNNLYTDIFFKENGYPRALVFDSSSRIRSYFIKNEKMKGQEKDYIINSIEEMK